MVNNKQARRYPCMIGFPDVKRGHATDIVRRRNVGNRKMALILWQPES